ncbi:MAG: hypothetical protein P8182_19695, partial [Deltaproteobacteria bacterium]
SKNRTGGGKDSALSGDAPVHTGALVGTTPLLQASGHIRNRYDGSPGVSHVLRVIFTGARFR